MEMISKGVDDEGTIPIGTKEHLDRSRERTERYILSVLQENYGLRHDDQGLKKEHKLIQHVYGEALMF
jgi:hypothetical protein